MNKLRSSEDMELDLDELEAGLHYVIQSINDGNYGRARTKAWIQWGNVHRFRISLDDQCLLATTDCNLWALLTKAAYHLLNLWPLPCRRDYNCEWVYPYGFVPEGGCPYHD